MKIFILLFLASSATAIKIQCSFWNGYSLSVVGKVYTCDVRAMDFSDNPTTITGFTGTHMTNFTDADVNFVSFDAARCPTFNLTTVPKGFSSIFPKFSAFQFWKCGINVLNGDEFADYPNLEWILFYNSNLTRVAGNLFKPTPKMKFVGFQGNQLRNIGEGLISNLPNLKEASFLNNYCVNQVANTTAQFAALSETLRVNCPDNVTTTTTTTLAPSSNCDAYINQIIDLTTKLSNQAAILQQKEIELAQIKQENAILKATCN